ncbi:enoyl-CoA hydratase/isomerase family protein [Coralloluteibacterium stylophorae]|uniref:3-hydroxyisobutyryl-CoA hydrolase n=1 Tax=Coralloluteibacterium stylophorae TaxID=1776034 RepID=A0A8J7VW71_9GAMM|nr:enoyl-CoA hydratase/isomerase family protein [Coralloluteibacterium stylophorae]MBS7458418.1 enoyl-CoA hydratase/isomerase family protein [Coralloluteibacterium stylophorae]
MSGATDAPVLFEERAAGGGARIGIATLNAPKTLNGLSLEMVDLLDARLTAWAADEGIAVVVLQGAGEKAFCAGGDLHSLYRTIREHRSGDVADVLGNAYACAFFEREYRLDYRIHTYPKPVLVWGHGIVMGGGMGLMAGASHRVVTEKSRLAMPEISVGLFPDVGGSWVLNRLPARSGLFLALTGAPVNAADALFAGLADHLVEQARRDEVFAALAATEWTRTADADAARLTAVLRAHAPADAPAHGPLRTHFDLVREACNHASLDEAVAAIAALPPGDAWLDRARATLAAGAPGSARLAWELQRRSRLLSLADVFRLEAVVAVHCAAHGDFAEGIRALLIDKDQTPAWNPARLEAADATWAQAYFDSPWRDGTHPLADLGRD